MFLKYANSIMASFCDIKNEMVKLKKRKMVLLDTVLFAKVAV